MIVVGVKGTRLHRAICSSVVQLDCTGFEGTILGAEVIKNGPAGSLPADRVFKFVDRVYVRGCVHPSGAFVEALVDKDLSPRDSAIGIQAFIALHLQLAAKEERGVRIDEQQGVVVLGV